MKTLKYILKTIQFLKSLNIGTKKIIANPANVELTQTKFSINSRQAPVSGKVPNSLFHQMYAEENETLFI